MFELNLDVHITTGLTKSKSEHLTAQYSPQCGKKLLGGWHGEIGLGYKGKTDLINGIKIEIGYNFRALKLKRDGKKLDPTCHALSVGIGFVF